MNSQESINGEINDQNMEVSNHVGPSTPEGPGPMETQEDEDAVLGIYSTFYHYPQSIIYCVQEQTTQFIYSISLTTIF